VLSGWVWGGSENSEIGDKGSRSGLQNSKSILAVTMVVGFGCDYGGRGERKRG
jgi:hypothetical protein